MPSVEPRLNLRQRKFAELVATGVSPREAYTRAGYQSGTERALAVGASRLQLDPKVAAYVRELRIAAGEPVSDPETEARVAEENRQAAILTIREKREFLARIVRTPIGALTEQSDLCQELQRTRRVVGRGEAATPWETEKVKMPGKLEAIKLDSLLAGELRDPRRDEEPRTSGPAGADGIVISVDLLREIQERRAAAMARMGVSLGSPAPATDSASDSPTSLPAGQATTGRATHPEGHGGV